MSGPSLSRPRQTGGDSLSRPRLEWPTLALAAVIYGGWAAATRFHAALPWPLLLVIGGWLTAWHGSLQHEVIHDHPTPWRWANTALAMPPLILWLPFELYRRSHQVHHVREHLTEPGLDPETRYLAQGSGALARGVGAAQATLIGRLVLGPMIDAAAFLADEAARMARGDRERMRIWAVHLVWVAAVIAWLRLVCHMSLTDYLLFFVYPGVSLSLIRSYAEHRADPDPMKRTAAVERAPVLGLLFLYNNLHPAHHHQPSTPWYALPALYRRERERLLKATGGLVYEGYGDVFRRFLFHPHDALIHDEAVEARG